MSRILVAPLSAVEETIRLDRPSHIVTLLSPEHMIETPAGFPPERHLRLSVNDVAEADDSEAPPAPVHIMRLLNFGRAWKAEAPMLVHCWAGVSRSTAAAYILLCDRFGPGTEREVARVLRHRGPHACPNPLMIQLADAILERDGRMIDAIESIGRGSMAVLGARIELPLARAEL